MSRYTESVCKLCRREGQKLFLKGDRCYTEKCAVDRRPYPPGQHGQNRSKFSEYGTQLREKQKAKRIYGLGERPFRNAFKKADRKKGVTGENLLLGLEARLDNMVYRSGFANSRTEARQLVLHGHVLVNQKKVNIPSYLCKPGEEIQVKEKSQKVARIAQSVESVDRRGVPAWLELDKQTFKAKIQSLPERQSLTLPVQEQLIVELYSK